MGSSPPGCATRRGHASTNLGSVNLWRMRPFWLGETIDCMPIQMAGVGVQSMRFPPIRPDRTPQALIAWFATMVGGFGFAVLMAGFAGAYHADKRLYVWYRLPDWFIRLRFVLTCVVVAALALTVIAANVRG